MISQKVFQSTLKKLKAHEGVRGVIVTNSEGLPISSTLDTEKTEKVAALITSLVGKARSVVEELDEMGLNFFTINTETGEVLVAPEETYILIVLKEQ